MDIDRDYYAVLGVVPSVEGDILKAVHRVLVKKYYPDTFRGDKNSRIGREVGFDALGFLTEPKNVSVKLR